MCGTRRRRTRRCPAGCRTSARARRPTARRAAAGAAGRASARATTARTAAATGAAAAATGAAAAATAAAAAATAAAGAATAAAAMAAASPHVRAPPVLPLSALARLQEPPFTVLLQTEPARHAQDSVACDRGEWITLSCTPACWGSLYRAVSQAWLLRGQAAEEGRAGAHSSSSAASCALPVPEEQYRPVLQTGAAATAGGATAGPLPTAAQAAAGIRAPGTEPGVQQRGAPWPLQKRASPRSLPRTRRIQLFSAGPLSRPRSSLLTQASAHAACWLALSKGAQSAPRGPSAVFLFPPPTSAAGLACTPCVLGPAMQVQGCPLPCLCFPAMTRGVALRAGCKVAAGFGGGRVNRRVGEVPMCSCG